MPRYVAFLLRRLLSLSHSTSMKTLLWNGCLLFLWRCNNVTFLYWENNFLKSHVLYIYFYCLASPIISNSGDAAVSNSTNNVRVNPKICRCMKKFLTQ